LLDSYLEFFKPLILYRTLLNPLPAGKDFKITLNGSGGVRMPLRRDFELYVFREKIRLKEKDRPDMAEGHFLFWVFLNSHEQTSHPLKTGKTKTKYLFLILC
jgi:hypothetical protein